MFVTDEWLAAASGAHRTTIARWRRTRRFPRALVRLAAVELDGELGIISEAWQGWRLCRRSGDLTAPAGWPVFAPGELAAAPWRAAYVAELERRRCSFAGLLQDLARAVARRARAIYTRPRAASPQAANHALARRRRRWQHRGHNPLGDR